MNRKGVLNIEGLVEVHRPFGVVILLPKIDVLADFPHGSGLDMFSEHVNNIVYAALNKKITSAEGLCENILAAIEKKYPTMNRGEVRMEADYVVIRETPRSGQKTQEMYKLLAGAVKENGRIRRMVGAEVVGMSSCPCAMEGLVEHSKKLLNKKFSKEEVEYILKTVPVASHNQRNLSMLLIEVPEKYEIEVEELIEILEKSMSSRIYELLKREDEIKVVLNGYKNPNFVEDIVRKILVEVVKKYPMLPGECRVSVKSESFESIHQHNAIAERASTLRELRKEMRASA